MSEATVAEKPAAAKPKPVTILNAINAAIADAMAADDRIVVLGEDVADAEEGGVVGVTKGLSTRFGDHRVRSTPISEQAIIGAAIGVSLAGWRPIAEIMLMNFTTVAMDIWHWTPLVTLTPFGRRTRAHLRAVEGEVADLARFLPRDVELIVADEAD